MAKHNTDPVLAHLIKAVNESSRPGVPVTVCVHGMVLTGVLIAQDVYFTELVTGNPLMNALQPTSGLLGSQYTKAVDAESGHHLHMRARHVAIDGEEALWRISLESVDAWMLRTTADSEAQDDRGPFARLLGA